MLMRLLSFAEAAPLSEQGVAERMTKAQQPGNYLRRPGQPQLRNDQLFGERFSECDRYQ